MSKTTLTFYGGLRTIGGTVIALQYEDSRVIFDFGLTYNPAANIFDGMVKLRNSAMVRDYLKLGLIPEVNGLYSREDLPASSPLLPAQEYTGETAVLISHLHLDHMGAMGFIDPSVPVFMTTDSHRLYQALETTGEGVAGSRSYSTCDFGQPFSIGKIKVTPLKLDHDIIGACAFHIETPDGAIIYTGDLRLHGKNPQYIDSFIQEAKKLGYTAVLMEGTSLRNEEELPENLISPDRSLPADLLTETDIHSRISDILKATSGIALFNIYHRNIDRINGILQAGKSAGRKVILEAATAKIANTLGDNQEFFIYESEDIRTAKESGNLPEWLKALLSDYPSLSFKDINENPGGYLLQNSYDQSLELFDLNTEEGMYLHSNGVPLGSFDPAYENLNRILSSISLERVEIGTSGHATPQHLKYIVDELDPAILIPLHSFHPERLQPKTGRQLLPSYGKTYILSGGDVSEG
ncbi:MBL fold metallo-hydrolase [Bacillus sp. P14.5]|uniref:MBL fold metallo-hydrolase n=1 Tax=Bacillus sp. P14.5 TaxID=1983400 RepID=UPI000DE83EBF|nr:MBL fold metallo-hydrolase [Bacillus sp. P14.5]